MACRNTSTICGNNLDKDVGETPRIVMYMWLSLFLADMGFSSGARDPNAYKDHRRKKIITELASDANPAWIDLPQEPTIQELTENSA